MGADVAMMRSGYGLNDGQPESRAVGRAVLVPETPKWLEERGHLIGGNDWSAVCHVEERRAVAGCLLLLSPAVYGPTALRVFHDLPRSLMAGTLFSASGLAVWALTRRQPSLKSLAALLLQQSFADALRICGNGRSFRSPLR
jgi:hypothetical protein